MIHTQAMRSDTAYLANFHQLMGKELRNVWDDMTGYRTRPICYATCIMSGAPGKPNFGHVLLSGRKQREKRANFLFNILLSR